MESCHIRGCIHSCVVDSYNCISSPFLYYVQSIRTGPNIVCNDQLNRARVSFFFTVDVGHFNFSLKMQVSFKHGASCFVESGCKTPKFLSSLSNKVDAIKDHVTVSARLNNCFLKECIHILRRLKTRFLEDVSIERHL